MGWDTRPGRSQQQSNMADLTKKASANQWTNRQAYGLAVVCLVIGIAGGWFVRGSQSAGTVASAASGIPSSQGEAQPTPEQLKRMADKQVEPLLAQLKSDPSNAELRANIANVYYDTHQFATAIDYYQRSLQVKPDNASVRTDMAPLTGIPTMQKRPSPSSSGRLRTNRTNRMPCSISGLSSGREK